MTLRSPLTGKGRLPKSDPDPFQWPFAGLQPRAGIAKWVIPVLAAMGTALLTIASFPPFDLAETAYFFLLPMLLWAFSKPGWLPFAGCAWAGGAASWLVILWWLRHVTLPGTVILSLFLGLFPAAWLVAARWAVVRLEARTFVIRLVAIAGLSGVWVVLEHFREVVFTGFPWLPLAASQWERPALLQIVAYTGYGGVSFLLVFFNLGLLFYIRRWVTKRGRRPWYERICPEFYTALLLLLAAASSVLWGRTLSLQREALFSAAVVQPYIRQTLKWDPLEADKNLRTIEKQTLFASANGGAIILWPESVTPWPVRGNDTALAWAEEIARQAGKPILMGNMAKEGDRWYNIVCAVTPESGLLEPYYAKRRLVPFGEYVPLQSWLPFVKKAVPLEGSFEPGEFAQIITLNIANTMLRAGPLICYEDIFPRLARQTVRSGVDFLFVATNNAWYGEEGGAYQHAAHAVLRAVETRRPVIRCGNGGWSGWIDEYGNIREVLQRPGKGIYFRGSDIVHVDRDRRWAGRLTFYVRFGDWFVLACSLVSLLAFFTLLFEKKEHYEPGSLLHEERG